METCASHRTSHHGQAWIGLPRLLRHEERAASRARCTTRPQGVLHGHCPCEPPLAALPRGCRAYVQQAARCTIQGLPPTPQVRALLIHPDNPAVLYAGTQYGPYRSDDRGEHWEALEAPREGRDVWSLAFHPNNP